MVHECWAALSDTSVLWYMPPCTAHQEIALFDLPRTARTVGDDSHHTPHLPTTYCTLLDAAHSCGQSSSDYHTREPLEDFATTKSALVWPGKCALHPMTASTITLLHSKENSCLENEKVTVLFSCKNYLTCPSGIDYLIAWEAPGFIVTWAPGSTLVTSLSWRHFSQKQFYIKSLLIWVGANQTSAMFHAVESMAWRTNHLKPSGYALGNAWFSDATQSLLDVSCLRSVGQQDQR